jgi:hypothetical protein
LTGPYIAEATPSVPPPGHAVCEDGCTGTHEFIDEMVREKDPVYSIIPVVSL